MNRISCSTEHKMLASNTDHELDFSSSNLLTDGMSRKQGLLRICHFLQSADLNGSASTLDLSGNRLTNHELNQIVYALQSNPCASFDEITSMDLSHNMLRHNDDLNHIVTSLVLSKFPQMESINITESGLLLSDDVDLPFDVIDATKHRPVQWPERRSVDENLDDVDQFDQFDFEFIDETDSESGWNFEEDQLSSDEDLEEEECSDLLFVEEEADESRGLSPNALNFYVLSLREDPSVLSSCDEDSDEDIESESISEPI